MYAIIEYDDSGSTKKIKNVRMSYDLGIDYLASVQENKKLVWCRLSEANSKLIAVLMTNPTSPAITVESGDGEEGQAEVVLRVPTSGITVDPYSRKIADADIDKSVRPAAIRAGTTSIFKNL